MTSNAALRTEMDQLTRDNVQLHNSQKTTLIFSSHKSLKEWDEGLARGEQEQKAIAEALGDPVVVASRRLLLSEIAAEAVNTLFAISPAMSRPTAQMAAVDPEFWTPKPAVASGKALASKKVAKDDKPRP